MADSLLAAEHAPSSLSIDPAAGHLGITLSSSDALPGVVVTALHPNDLAAKAGLAVGDVIVAINGVRVPTHEAAMNGIWTTTSSLVISYHPATIAAELIRAKQARGVLEGLEVVKPQYTSTRGPRESTP
jgi:S1-C subfamily serine protease